MPLATLKADIGEATTERRWDDLGAVGDDDQRRVRIHTPVEEKVSQAAIAFLGLGRCEDHPEDLFAEAHVMVDGEEDAGGAACPAPWPFLVPEMYIHRVDADLGW